MPKISVSKSCEIGAPVERVFELVRDFCSWPDWSPWLIADPECRLEIGKDEYSWDGEVCGKGTMEVLSVDEGHWIDYQLTFLKPFPSKARVRMEFEEVSGGTSVTWIMNGGIPFFIFWMKSLIQAGVGMDYERGLKMLKELIEVGSVSSEVTLIGLENFSGLVGVTKGREVAIDGMEEAIGEDYEEVRKSYPDGQGFGVYPKWDIVKGRASYQVGVLLDEEPSAVPEGMEVTRIPEGEVYAVRHIGSYGHLANGWAAVMMHERAREFRASKAQPPFELYEVEGEKGEVKICVPVK